MSDQEKSDMDLDVDFAWKVILRNLPPLVTGNVMIQNWQDGVLVHVADGQGVITKTVGAAELSQAIKKL